MKKRNRPLFIIFGVIIVLFLIFIYKPAVNIKEVLPELNDPTLQNISVLNPWEAIVQLNEKEMQQLLKVFENETVKKKRIPNIQKFNRNKEVAISLDFSSTENNILLFFDFKRNIIGIRRDSGIIRQFILEKDTEIVPFIKQFL